MPNGESNDESCPISEPPDNDRNDDSCPPLESVPLQDYESSFNESSDIPSYLGYYCSASLCESSLMAYHIRRQHACMGGLTYSVRV